jgi:Mrp family chromosome partitioning ATPase
MQKAEIKANLDLDYAGSEAFNTVCSNLTFSGKNIKRIVVTSCEPNDGKSFIAIQVAVNMARRGKRVLLMDDVISTGGSLRAMEELVEKAGGIVAGKVAVLAEGDAINREDIRVLAPLPLFNADGEAL